MTLYANCFVGCDYPGCRRETLITERVGDDVLERMSAELKRRGWYSPGPIEEEGGPAYCPDHKPKGIV